ncbi:MAG TPA: tetratricopeptide repeat protein [Bacteroidia bacterium]
MIEEKISLKEKVDDLNQLAFENRNLETEKSISLSKEAQKISREINYNEGLATALNNEGFCYVQITDYELALEKCFEALRIFTEIKNEKGIALAHYNLTLTYQRLGEYNTALDHVSKSLSYHQKVNDRFEIARCYLQLGFLYGWMNDVDTSIEVYEEGLKISRAINNRAVEAACLMGLGQTYLLMKEYDKSGDNLFTSMSIRKQINDMRGYAAAMAAYLSLCFETGKYDIGEELSREGIKMATELGDRMGIARFMVDLGKIQLRQNKMEEAEKTLLEALQTAEQINLKMSIPPANLYLSEIFQKKGDFQNALKYFQRFHESKEELYNTDAALKAKSVQLTGKIEKAQQEAEISRLRNVELKNAYDEIAEKNKDITDSINYARRIQHTLLASQDLLKRNLNDFFVFYKPKDIVSGDFYWAVEKDRNFYLAVCDSTGHGVPGAFMSLLNISFMNEAINEKNISHPNEVFNHVRKRLIESISNDGGQDGMDAILLKLKTGNEKLILEYSGANNAPILIHDKKLFELETDTMPVGMSDRKNSFSAFSIPSHPDDQDRILYLYTDGYADQFGGPKGKKFKYKQLHEKLLAISDKPLAEQKKLLEETFENWKGNNSQTDDVLIIGIKL